MFLQRVALFAVALFMLTGLTYCSHCDVSNPNQNCLTLWTAFQNNLLNQHNNALRIDLMFNQPSRITPTVVKVIYNYSITGLDDCNSICTNSNCSVVLGWTAQALYRYFHVSVINQLRFQLPFLIIKTLEGMELGGEPDVDDYLWVGDDKPPLPELFLTLDVTFTPDNNTLDGCPSNKDIINALGELNHWLRAFAKVAMQGTQALQNIDPAYKGYTLPQTGVEPYNWDESKQDPNERLGQGLFLYMYIVNAVTAYVFGIFLYRLLLNVYESEVEREKNFFDDRFRVQFFTVTLMASVYLGAIYLTDMGYYFHKRDKANVFIILKMVFTTMPFMGWILLIAVYYYKSDTLRSKTKALCLRQKSFPNMISSHRSDIIRVLLVGLLTHEIVLIILSVFPTLLLLFAHPMNTFALLVIHVALFYTVTIAGIIVIEQLYKNMWIPKLLDKCRTCKCKHTREQKSKPIADEPQTTPLQMEQNTRGGEIEDNSIINGIFLAIGVLLMFIGLGFVYVSVMWFYQFLFLRNLSNNLAFDIIIKYVPSAGIAAFGYLIQKGTFSKTKKEDKNEKLWLKLGELSNISDDDLNKLDKAKKENIVQLRNLCSQPLANNGQPNQDGQPKEEETNEISL